MIASIASCKAIFCGKRNQTIGMIFDWVILWVLINILTDYL